MKALDFVFWGAPLAGRPFEEHIHAAVAGGFSSLAVASSTVHEAQRRGISLAQMRRQAHDAGVPFRHYDSLATWAPMQLSKEQLGEDMYDRWTTSPNEALEICSALELRCVLLNSGFIQDTVPEANLVERFARFCKDAARLGLWVDLEPMPFLGIRTLADASRIVQGVTSSNAGILLDTWHFAKSGQPLSEIEQVPGELLRTIQVADGYMQDQGMPLEQETVSRRAWPGRGNLPLQAIVSAALSRGHVFSIGQEVFTTPYHQVDARELGKDAGAAFFALMKQTAPELG